jgi:hypothetical protein
VAGYLSQANRVVLVRVRGAATCHRAATSLVTQIGEVRSVIGVDTSGPLVVVEGVVTW